MSSPQGGWQRVSRPAAGRTAQAPGCRGVQHTGTMAVLVWIPENTWAACVDAALSLAPADAGITLLAVADTGTAEAAHGAFSGMFGRAAQDPAGRLEANAEAAANQLLDAAAERLGRPAQRVLRRGRPEHEVTSAAADADMLIVARDVAAPGPRSLGKAVRFVVDHAPCPVLLIWPGPASGAPEPPPHKTPGPPGPPHPRWHLSPHRPHHPPPHHRPGPHE